jgi:hypothetical protein
VTVGGIGELSLRDLLLDHRRFDERHGSERLCITAHTRLSCPVFPQGSYWISAEAVINEACR